MIKRKLSDRTKLSEQQLKRIEEIPEGEASGKLVHGCLVLEGGAFRGLHTQGFLDAMMMNDLNLDCVIGVSAGALAGLNYCAGQIGRSAKINLTYRHDSRYIGARAFIHSRSMLDVGFLTEDRGIFEPLDIDKIKKQNRRYVAVATDCRTGKPAYFEFGKTPFLMEGARASATIPYISPMVWIDGVPYLDGGCSCKVPYDWAMNENYDKIIVIRTRDASFRKEEKTSRLAYIKYHRYPEFAKVLAENAHEYNCECDQLETLHLKGSLLQIMPSEPITVGAVEYDLDKLEDLYWKGYSDAMNSMETMKRYLKIPAAKDDSNQ